MRQKEEEINLKPSLLDDMEFRYMKIHLKNFDEKANDS